MDDPDADKPELENVDGDIWQGKLMRSASFSLRLPADTAVEIAIQKTMANLLVPLIDKDHQLSLSISVARQIKRPIQIFPMFVTSAKKGSSANVDCHSKAFHQSHQAPAGVA